MPRHSTLKTPQSQVSDSHGRTSPLLPCQETGEVHDEETQRAGEDGRGEIAAVDGVLPVPDHLHREAAQRETGVGRPVLAGLAGRGGGPGGSVPSGDWPGVGEDSGDTGRLSCPPGGGTGFVLRGGQEDATPTQTLGQDPGRLVHGEPQ